ncbi:hypothetical protein M7I_6158 [Glarea lozoyensis 74030]|uniref:Uncharacterized protein n=1 Tax=Glarea lozoyensis (strain ATCC 74030 / MF5533) TaxID=1104152 RepID=H0ETT9_GLAL7|nr:hypothetical protein M7I_6158 [Glarea lozoyensis 74030]
MDDPISANPGHAADLLWKHQLRQEHAAAMKMIQDLENRQSLVQQKANFHKKHWKWLFTGLGRTLRGK